jgi:hypothetical protein
MDQLTQEPSKKVYVQPSLERRDQLAEVSEGMFIIGTSGKLPPP